MKASREQRMKKGKRQPSGDHPKACRKQHCEDHVHCGKAHEALYREFDEKDRIRNPCWVCEAST